MTTAEMLNTIRQMMHDWDAADPEIREEALRVAARRVLRLPTEEVACG